jgi:hypothetical protein
MLKRIKNKYQKCNKKITKIMFLILLLTKGMVYLECDKMKLIWQSGIAERA